MNEDYRSRALGVVGAIGVLIAGVVVDGTRKRVPDSPAVAVTARPHAVARTSTATQPVSTSGLEGRCHPFC